MERGVTVKRDGTDPRGTGRIATVSGVIFDVCKPDPRDVRITDIARALSHTARFSGHTRFFYSVARHSIEVADRVFSVFPGAALVALLHDASEAYLQDIPSPIKYLDVMDGYRHLEARVMEAVYSRFRCWGLSREEKVVRSVSEADSYMLAVEAKALLNPSVLDFDSAFRTETFGRKIVRSTSDKDRSDFMQRFGWYSTLSGVGTQWTVRA